VDGEKGKGRMELRYLNFHRKGADLRGGKKISAQGERGTEKQGWDSNYLEIVASKGRERQVHANCGLFILILKTEP